jgi:hypothetical protein
MISFEGCGCQMQPVNATLLVTSQRPTTMRGESFDLLSCLVEDSAVRDQCDLRFSPVTKGLAPFVIHSAIKNFLNLAVLGGNIAYVPWDVI